MVILFQSTKPQFTKRSVALQSRRAMKDKVTDIKTQPHFLVTLHFVYFSLKHNVIGFLLVTIKSSDLWGGFVAHKKFITALNHILYHFFSKY
jgi:hypothetical protein